MDMVIEIAQTAYNLFGINAVLVGLLGAFAGVDRCRAMLRPAVR